MENQKKILGLIIFGILVAASAYITPGLPGPPGVNGTNGINQSDIMKINKTDIGEASGGTLSDSRLSSNIPLKNNVNVFTAEQQISYAGGSNGGLYISGGSAGGIGITIDSLTNNQQVQYRMKRSGSGFDTDWYYYIPPGNLGIYWYNNGDRFSLTNQGKPDFYNLSAGTGDALCLSGTRVVKNSGLTTCLASSETSKTNITDISKNMTISFLKLKPITYNSIFDDRLNYGFSAQQVEKIYPELVGHDEKGNISGVKYENMVAILTKVIQEQQAVLEQICTRNQTLCQ